MFGRTRAFVHRLRSVQRGVVFLGAIAAAVAQEQTRDLDLSIAKYRKGVLVVEAPPGTEVTVEQQRHEFWFGAALANQAFNGGMRPEDRENYRNVFLTNFNAAVTENALKWHDMEPRQDYVRHIRTLLDQGVPVGGIGVQGHAHTETFDSAALRNALEKLSQFNLPIRVTEFNMPGQRSRFYRTVTCV